MKQTKIRSYKSFLKRQLVLNGGIALLLLAFVSRFLFPYATYFNHTGIFWGTFLALVACLSRIIVIIIDICYAQKPWTRIIIPTLIFLELALLLVGRASREIVGGVIAAAEVLLISAGIIVSIQQRYHTKSDEPREIVIERFLLLFLPKSIARLAASEAVIIASALSAIFHRIYIPTGTGYGYVKSSVFRFLLIILLISLPLELLIFENLSRTNSTLLGVLLVLAHLWVILWTLGIYVTMKRRPHQITSTEIKIYRGILDHARFPTTAVETVRPLRSSISISHRVLSKDVAYLTVKGSPIVEITLNTPVPVFSLLGKSERQATRLFVSADNPIEFCQAILSTQEELTSFPKSSR